MSFSLRTISNFEQCGLEGKISKQHFKGTHCSKLKIVLNENDTPQNQQFLLVYTLVLPKESRLQKSVDIQG